MLPSARSVTKAMSLISVLLLTVGVFRYSYSMKLYDSILSFTSLSNLGVAFDRSSSASISRFVVSTSSNSVMALASIISKSDSTCRWILAYSFEAPNSAKYEEIEKILTLFLIF